MLTIHYHSSHHRTEPTCQPCQADIFHLDDRATAGAGDTGARHRTPTHTLIMLPTLRRRTFEDWHICLYAENHPCLVGVWLHREHHSFVVFLAQPARFEQRHRSTAILAGDGTRPQI